MHAEITHSARFSRGHSHSAHLTGRTLIWGKLHWGRGGLLSSSQAHHGHSMAVTGSAWPNKASALPCAAAAYGRLAAGRAQAHVDCGDVVQRVELLLRRLDEEGDGVMRVFCATVRVQEVEGLLSCEHVPQAIACE